MQYVANYSFTRGCRIYILERGSPERKFYGPVREFNDTFLLAVAMQERYR